MNATIDDDATSFSSCKFAACCVAGVAKNCVLIAESKGLTVVATRTSGM